MDFKGGRRSRKNADTYDGTYLLWLQRLLEVRRISSAAKTPGYATAHAAEQAKTPAHVGILE